MGTKAELTAIIGDVVSYFQGKPPSDKTVDIWLKKLDGLNLLASRSRIVDIITNGDAPPRNFPAAVKSAYSTWLRDQPRERQQGGCRHCIQGLIHAKKDGNVYAWRCGHCNTSESTIIPTATRYQLQEQGYSLDWQHDFGGPVDRETRESIKALASAPEVERRERAASEPLEIPF
jgi:hypothetical protein